MPICSYLLTPRKGKLSTVQAALEKLPGVETFAAHNRELLVVVTDTANQAQEDDLNEKIHAIEDIDCLALSFGAMN